MYRERKRIEEVKVFIAKGWLLVTSIDEDTFIDRFTILFTFSFDDRLVSGFTIAIRVVRSQVIQREFTALSFPCLYQRYTLKMKTFLAPLFWFLNRLRSFASWEEQKKNESIGRRIYFPALQQTTATWSVPFYCKIYYPRLYSFSFFIFCDFFLMLFFLLI